MGGIQGWHIVIIIVLAIVLFGAPKLPGMARSIGQSLRIFKSEVKQMKDENNTDGPTEPVEGRVVTNPTPQTYAPTYQSTEQPDQAAPLYGQTTQHHSGDQAQEPRHATGPGAGQAGQPHQGGTSHSSQ